MKVKNKFFTTLKLVGLISVMPLLIGHGANIECLFDPDCPKKPPTMDYSHVISGSDNPSSRINIGNSLVVRLEGKRYKSPSNHKNKSITPIKFINHNKYTQLLDVTVNGSSSKGSIGEMWIHSNDENIKLIHPTNLGSNINAIFQVRSFYYNEPQSSISSSSNNYLLSSGSSTADPFLMNTKVEFYINDVRIFNHNGTEDPRVQPISFSATSGDKLRIVAGGNKPSGSITAIWLHTPTGKGVKLSHVASNLVSQRGVFLDLTYQLPE